MADKNIIEMDLYAFIEVIGILPFIEISAQVVRRTAVDKDFHSLFIISQFDQGGVALTDVDIKAFEPRRIADITFCNPPFDAKCSYFFPVTLFHTQQFDV